MSGYMKPAGTSTYGMAEESDRLDAMLRPSKEVERIFGIMEQSGKATEWLNNLTKPAFDFDLGSHWPRQLVEQSRKWRDITRPLERLHASMGLGSEIASLATKANPAHLALESMSNPWRETIDSIQASLSSFANARSTLLQTLDTSHLARLEELSRPFHIESALASSAFAESLKMSSDLLEMVGSFRLPALDPISTTAIARLWGAETLDERIRDIREEVERALREAKVQKRHEEPKEDIASETHLARRPNFWDILNILSILMAIAMFAYQNWDSAQTEARLTGEIRVGNPDLKKQLAEIQSMLGQALSVNGLWGNGQTQFVVLSRVAHILKQPRPGATVIAEVFPNQVVDLAGERGKWIRVGYYDWMAGERREGWALKKYFVRVRLPEKGLPEENN